MENSQENTTFILADVKVFDFLKEKAGDRKTKTEAYWDLLDRSMAGFVSPFVRKLERKLLPNQCHVTISDLAEFWHWHRATVRTFLDALESFGLLERTKLNKSVIITMTVQSGKNATAGTEQDEPDFATRIGSILSEWVIGKKTSAAAEQKQRTGCRIQFQLIFHHGTEAVNGFAHIGIAADNVDPFQSGDIA